MAKVFFTSDTHFNHANIIKYCGRPFSSVEEMDREMIARWNAAVGPQDTVYHLGDFAMGKPADWAAVAGQLHGARKILILGGHDRSPQRMLEAGFSEVHGQLEWNGWLLQHKPAATQRKLLCGHVHNKWLRLGDIINVGVDVWGFSPRTLEELLRAEQSAAEYDCLHCGRKLKHLEDDPAHQAGDCAADDVPPGPPAPPAGR